MIKAKKHKLFKKTTTFNGTTITLYSLDGEIWSTREWELQKIAERHEAQRLALQEGVEAKVAADKDEGEEESSKPQTPLKVAPPVRGSAGKAVAANISKDQKLKDDTKSSIPKKVKAKASPKQRGKAAKATKASIPSKKKGKARKVA